MTRPQMTRRALLLGVTLIPLAAAAWAEGLDAQALTFRQMQANGGVIVDIRTPAEWSETGVIDGARLLTFEDPQAFIAALGPDLAAGRDLILICRSGRRSAAAAEALQSMIPNHIISVEGGMNRILAEGYQPVAP